MNRRLAGAGRREAFHGGDFQQVSQGREIGGFRPFRQGERLPGEIVGGVGAVRDLSARRFSAKAPKHSSAFRLARAATRNILTPAAAATQPQRWIGAISILVLMIHEE